MSNAPITAQHRFTPASDRAGRHHGKVPLRTRQQPPLPPSYMRTRRQSRVLSVRLLPPCCAQRTVRSPPPGPACSPGSLPPRPCSPHHVRRRRLKPRRRCKRCRGLTLVAGRLPLRHQPTGRGKPTTTEPGIARWRGRM